MAPPDPQGSLFGDPPWETTLDPPTDSRLSSISVGEEEQAATVRSPPRTTIRVIGIVVSLGRPASEAGLV
jgi:hypothetical protein